MYRGRNVSGVHLCLSLDYIHIYIYIYMCVWFASTNHITLRIPHTCLSMSTTETLTCSNPLLFILNGWITVRSLPYKSRNGHNILKILIWRYISHIIGNIKRYCKPIAILRHRDCQEFEILRRGRWLPAYSALWILWLMLTWCHEKRARCWYPCSQGTRATCKYSALSEP